MGKSKNKVVDLKPESISEQELAQLHEIVRVINKIKFDIGALEIQKNMIMQNLEPANNVVQTLVDGFGEKYGSKNINIEDGTIIYEDDKPTDS
tara:strand:+ start:4969 stop:5247 length:279 start_codon:yes stop_codon:yes gene_type:complete